jgi:ADP-ribosylglycohydrolase
MSPKQRAQLSLDGLSVGDAFGQCFFNPFNHLPNDGQLSENIPRPPWRYTDDTEMAVCVFHQLEARGLIDQDELALLFARRFMADPERGYGGTVRKVLTDIYCGEPWREAAGRVFDGTGSMGNGSAMRVAPLGAFFGDDLPALIENARLSAEVTHLHPEAAAGAIAVAAAAAFAWNHRGQHSPRLVREFIDFVVEQTPAGETRAAIEKAADLPRTSEVNEAVGKLGNGSNITCPDTVPLCIWLAARCFGDYVRAMWTTASALGDIDTNCAIVGGIVSLSEAAPLPESWLAARGPLPSLQPLSSN